MFSVVVVVIFLSIAVGSESFAIRGPGKFCSLRPRIVNRSTAENIPYTVVEKEEDVKFDSFVEQGSVKQFRSTSDLSFQRDVLEKAGLSVVLFTSPWCGPCKSMVHSLERVMMDSSAISFYDIDTDHNIEIATKYHVRSIPTTLILKDGKVVSEIVGSVVPEIVSKQLSKHL